MVFILSALWWIRGLWKLPDGWDWLGGKLGLVLMGGAMLSTNFLLMDGAVFSPCCLTWDQTMVEVAKIMATSFKRFQACTAALSARYPAADHCPPMPPLETWGHSQASLGQSLLGYCSFFLGSDAHRVLFLPSKSLFPQSCVSSVINPTGLQSQILWEFSVPLLDPQVWKSVVGPRTFLPVWEFLWYNCSAVCGSSAQ